MKKAWWEYVLTATEKVRSATKWGFEKARDFVVEIEEDDPKENQVDAFEKEQEEKRVEQTLKTTPEPVSDSEPENEPVKSNDFTDETDGYAQEKKEMIRLYLKDLLFTLEDTLRGLTPKNKLLCLSSAKKNLEKEMQNMDPNESVNLLRQGYMDEIDRRINELAKDGYDIQYEESGVNEVENSSNLNEQSSKIEDVSVPLQNDTTSFDGKKQHTTSNKISDISHSNSQSSIMNMWIQSEKNFQNRVMAEQKRREGMVDQDVVVSNEGVILSPYAQMLFGKKENANFESSVEPRFDQEAETPKPKSVSDHTEKQEISNFEVVEEKALPSVDSDKEQRSTSSSKQKNRDVIVDVPYEVARTRLTPTQQKIIQAGVSKRKQSSEESITPEAKESIQNVSLKELIHQAAVTHEKAMSEVNERLEKEPVPEIVLPKRRRKKPKKSLLQRVVDRDNNSVRVVETKTQQDQVIQEGNLTRTIHIQQVKTDMLITETMPVSSLQKIPEKEAKGLPGASMKKKPMPKKQKSAKGATPKSAPKGSRRGVNMDRMSLLLKNLKEKGIAK